MTGDASTREPADKPALNLRWIGLGLLPLLLLVVVLVIIVATDGGLGERTAPPIEVLNVERVMLPEPNEIKVSVVNDGPDAITIAQVLVDDAYWNFFLSGDNTLGRLESTTITIPYPWVEGEAHAIAIISSTGVVFDAEVPVAIASPQSNWATVARFALIGTYVGVIPVALGLLWYPFMRRLGQGSLRFILALTVGLLVFLAVDMWEEAREFALEAPAAFDAPLLVPVVALLTFMLLMTIAARSRGSHEGLPLAYRIALGIGLHNLGEGLAIGAAFALGEVALGVFLVVGFTLHNVTEGIGIAAPIVRERPALQHFAGLTLLAGGPAILGVWIGGFIFSPLWTTIFLAIGIGAIAQVVVEVWRIIARGAERSGKPMLNWATFGGVTAGIAIMYVTALLIAA
ncbi:MAG: metal transporter [Chloroflexi bacterium]|nr:MAG: metal transporter [Chloroflexota bacterium]